MFLDSGKCFGFWEVFLDSGKCFGFWEVFLDSGKCFGFWEVVLDSGKCFGFWEVFLDSGTCFWILGRCLDSGKCFWILGRVLVSGKCFWILGRVLDSGKCFGIWEVFCPYEPPYFRALFSSELQVKEKQENVVELKVVKSTIVEEVLEFIYTGQASISYSSAHELLVASDYLIIPSLKSQTSQFLEKSMNVSNCFTLESFACQFNCDSFRQTAIKFMNENFVAVVKSEDFLILEFNKVKELMCRDELNISEEEEVYEAVLTWVKHDLSSRECFLADLLKCLRVFSLSKYSIDRILKKEELVKKSLTCIAIMNTGLEYFLYPDRFLGSVLKHRNSIEKDEHVVLLHDGVEI